MIPAGNKPRKNRILFKEGEYDIESAFLLGGENKAVPVTSPVITIYRDKTGEKQLQGIGQVRNYLLMNLMDYTDDPDMILDLAPGHQYRLDKPLLKAGKVFSPEIVSAIRFVPKTFWEKISGTGYQALINRLDWLSI